MFTIYYPNKYCCFKRIAILISLMVLFAGNVFGQIYHVDINNYPRDEEPGWADEANGIANDRNNWFITQRKRLWRIPVGVDLKHVSSHSPGVTVIELERVEQLRGFDHFGDLDYYEFEGRGFVLVPVEFAEKQQEAVIAIFDANTLRYVTHAALPERRHASWVAVDPEGYIYTSEFRQQRSIEKYRPEWNLLRERNELRLTRLPPVNLLDRNGSSIIIDSVQGGAISSDGRHLYLVAGYYTGSHPSWGIHIFNLRTGRRLVRSNKRKGVFKYEFHPNGIRGRGGEEPEGMAIWDLDDGRAPGIKGQLHVLLLRNEADTDDIYLKHYSNKIYVNKSARCPGNGWPSEPFCLLKTALNEALPEDIIMIKSGNYSERRLIINQRLTLMAIAGPVIIGRGR